MRTTAAVLVETSKPLEMADLEIPVLKAGQVLVEIAISGVCHTQLLEVRGHRGQDPHLPHCLGHEGSGVVQEVGPCVTKCRPGDRVILSWIKGLGADIPGTRYDWQGRVVNAGGVTTFSRHAVVSENRVTVMTEPMDLQVASFLGCAAPTGLGAVWNTARVRPGQSVAVFGCGGIGLCGVAASQIAGAASIVAIDVRAERLRLAGQMGATHTIDVSSPNWAEQLDQVLPRGADVAIEATGRPEVMRRALSAVRTRGGIAVIIGNARVGEHVEIDPHQFNLGKRLLGTWGGDVWPDRDLPLYCRMILQGQLSLAPLISPSYPLEQINRALGDLEAGTVARPLIDMRQA